MSNQDDRIRSFYWIDNKFLDDGWGKILKPHGIAIYNALLRHTNNDHTKDVWPSSDTLGNLTGMSERQAKREIKKLVCHRIISITERPGQTNIYVFNDCENWIKSPLPVTHSHPTRDTQSPLPVTHSHPTRDTQSPEQDKRTRRIEQDELNNHHHAPAAKNGTGNQSKNDDGDGILFNRILALNSGIQPLGVQTVLDLHRADLAGFAEYLTGIEAAGIPAGYNPARIIAALKKKLPMGTTAKPEKVKNGGWSGISLGD